MYLFDWLIVGHWEDCTYRLKQCTSMFSALVYCFVLCFWRQSHAAGLEPTWNSQAGLRLSSSLLTSASCMLVLQAWASFLVYFKIGPCDGCQDGSMIESAFWQAWWPEFNSFHIVEREKKPNCYKLFSDLRICREASHAHTLTHNQNK